MEAGRGYGHIVMVWIDEAEAAYQLRVQAVHREYMQQAEGLDEEELVPFLEKVGWAVAVVG